MGMGDVASSCKELMPAAMPHGVNRQRGAAHFKFRTTRRTLSAAARSAPESPRRAQKPVPAAVECLEQQEHNQQRWRRPRLQTSWIWSYLR